MKVHLESFLNPPAKVMGPDTDVIRTRFEKEIQQATILFQAKEDESTWQLFDSSLHRLSTVIGTIPGPFTNENFEEDLDGDRAALCSTIILGIKEVRIAIAQSILSDRTRLSGTALALVQLTASVLRRQFDPLIDLFYTSIVKCAGRANKIFVMRASACLAGIMHTSIPVRCIGKLQESFNAIPPIKSQRIAIMNALHVLLQNIDYPAIVQGSEVATSSGSLKPTAILDGFLKAALHDVAPEIRALASQCFQVYEALCHDEAQQYNWKSFENLFKLCFRFISQASPRIQKVLKLAITRAVDEKEGKPKLFQGTIRKNGPSSATALLTTNQSELNSVKDFSSTTEEEKSPFQDGLNNENLSSKHFETSARSNSISHRSSNNAAHNSNLGKGNTEPIRRSSNFLLKRQAGAISEISSGRNNSVATPSRLLGSGPVRRSRPLSSVSDSAIPATGNTARDRSLITNSTPLGTPVRPVSTTALNQMNSSNNPITLTSVKTSTSTVGISTSTNVITQKHIGVSNISVKASPINLRAKPTSAQVRPVWNVSSANARHTVRPTSIASNVSSVKTSSKLPGKNGSMSSSSRVDSNRLPHPNSENISNKQMPLPILKEDHPIEESIHTDMKPKLPSKVYNLASTPDASTQYVGSASEGIPEEMSSEMAAATIFSPKTTSLLPALVANFGSAMKLSHDDKLHVMELKQSTNPKDSISAQQRISIHEEPCIANPMKSILLDEAQALSSAPPEDPIAGITEFLPFNTSQANPSSQTISPLQIESSNNSPNHDLAILKNSPPNNSLTPTENALLQ